MIKLRGKNILLHKHDSVKMGQSANSTSSEFTLSSNNLTISTCQNNEGMNRIEIIIIPKKKKKENKKFLIILSKLN